MTPDTDPPLELDTTYYIALAFVCAEGCELRSRGEVITPNEAPIADAGPDQELLVGDTVSLDGSASSDPDDDDLTFVWTKLTGPDVELTGADGETPSFVAAEEGEYTFELTVTDSYDAEDTDTIIVLASTEGSADAGSTDGEEPDAVMSAQGGGCDCAVAAGRSMSFGRLLADLLGI